ncbi:alanine racemase [Simiduia curdlanivorans]|uniref:Alanine racemase n=1 Tax=Simiduia curdlanivorans TaxID=1492769 RepID=A0ABV8V715_9GAMM|nr:alanine racemase [Simiduia curdlanivorans]MDN3638422.1 alanine racemase [Simiduia curdlanivorans]
MSHHDGILTVNLRAIARNWLALSRKVGEAQCAAVVKANAYGLGMVPVARSLAHVGCRTFFVATVDEAIELREGLGEAPVIVVLGGVRPGREPALVANAIWPSLFSVDAIARWQRATTVADVSAPCVVKVNTGMTRLGLDLSELANYVASPEARQLDVRYFMSHLACADEPAHPLNREQLGRYQEAAALAASVWPQARRSFANSSGIFLGAEWHQQLARPGAALYGVNPTPGQPNPMEPVVSLRLPIIQYRLLADSAAVGYSATATCQPGQRLAVVLGGYADGLQRQLSSRGEGVFAGRRVPLVGRVSMDATIFDVSAIPESELPPIGAAYIEVLNSELTVNLVASHMNTIGYEVLTSLGNRYQREYVELGDLPS